MTDDPQVDLELIAGQQRQIIGEMDELREDMRVMTAILQRPDSTVGGLANEVRLQPRIESQLGHQVHG